MSQEVPMTPTKITQDDLFLDNLQTKCEIFYSEQNLQQSDRFWSLKQIKPGTGWNISLCNGAL